MVPQEEGVDRFRDREDEDTPLPIFPLGRRGITLAKADISNICCDGIAVDDKNDPTPDNFMHFDDFLPTLSSLTSVFHGVYT